MHSYLVAVVDSVQARFFSLTATTAADFPEAQPFNPHLSEHSSLNNMEKPMAVKGTNNNLIGRKHHGHRHEKTTQSEEINRRFAGKVTQHIGNLVDSFQGHHLILVAEPHILGNLRESLPQQVTAKMSSVHELAKDLCRLSAHDLEKYLINKQLLPSPRTKSKP